MEFLNVFSYLGNALALLPEGLLLAASWIYLRKRGGTDAILMAVGALLMFGMTIGWTVVDLMESPFAQDRSGAETFFRMLSYANVGAELIFLSGLLMLVMQQRPRTQGS